MEKTELPSEERRAALRAAGIVPFSNASVFFLSLSAASIWLLARRDKLSEITLLTSAEGVYDFHLAQNIEGLLVLIPEGVFVVLLSTLVAGLLQTGFLILSPFSGEKETLPIGIPRTRVSLAQILARHAAILVCCGMVVIALGSLVGVLIGFFQVEDERVPGAVLRLFDLALKGVIAFSIPMGILLYLLERFNFRVRYKMTRDETLAEGR